MIFPHVYINGQFLPLEKALIPVYDLGLLRGLGIFDFLKVWDGIPVFAEDHIERLQHSLHLMGFHTGMKTAEWYSLLYEMIRINSAEKAGFRIVVTGGFSEDGYTIPEKKNIYLMLHHLPENDPAPYEKGVRLLSSSYQRDMPAAKTTIYLQSMQAQPLLKIEGAFEILYHWNGVITECSRCNIFFIDHDGVIHSPANGMLRGITRKQILAIAEEQDIPIQLRDIHLDEIQHMAGAFLTATTKGALPVVKIDDTLIGNGTVHPLAVQLQSLYEKRVEAYLKEARLHHSSLV
jgi:D-alanine transaminase/branched-chain amino acid aminotransferase